jgi:hypothetical protein
MQWHIGAHEYELVASLRRALDVVNHGFLFLDLGRSEG